MPEIEQEIEVNNGETAALASPDTETLIEEETESETDRLIQKVCQTNIEEVDVTFDLSQENNISAHNSVSSALPDIYSRSIMPEEFGSVAKSLRPILTRIGMIAYYVINNPDEKPPYTNGWDLSEIEIEQIKKSLDEIIIELAKTVIAEPEKIHTIPQEIQPEALITAIAYLKVKTIFEKISEDDSSIITAEATNID